LIVKRKHFYVHILIFTLILSVVFNPITVDASSLDTEAESAIIVDADSGKVLYAKKPDIALPPASMTKMMTEYLVWEAVENGEISWDDTTEISDYAYEISAVPAFSGVGLRQNVPYTVEELYEAMAINSDNGTSIALAELIAGSEGEFVKRMNERGEELGLEDFRFVNSTGLDNKDLGDNYPEGTSPDDVNLLSARSAALLAYHLINDYPESLDISKIPSSVFDEQIITNWNWMLPHEGENFKQYYYEGVDGLKTGYTELAGYCFTATAEQDGKRLIVVIMKTDSYDERFVETAKLFDYGFNNFTEASLFAAGDQKEDETELPVAKGKEEEVEIAIADGFEQVIKAGEEEEYELEYHIDESVLNEDGALTAPIEEGEKVGEAKLVYTGGEDHGYILPNGQDTVDIVTIGSVEESNWFMLTLKSIGDFFSNLFSTVTEKIKGLFS